MSMRNLYNKIRGMKVKDAINRAIDNYQAKYIKTSSPDPLYHVIFGYMIISYLVAYPEKRRQQEEKEKQQAMKLAGH